MMISATDYICPKVPNVFFGVLSVSYIVHIDFELAASYLL